MSEGLLISALAAYGLATLAFSAALMLTRLRAPVDRSRVPASDGRAKLEDPGTDGPVATTVAPPAGMGTRRAGLASGIGVSLTILGLGLHAAFLVARTLASGRAPLGNMFEFAVVSAFATVAAYLLIGRKTGQTRQLGLLAILPVTTIMTLAVVVLYDEPAVLVPALRSVWLSIHVSAAAIGVGAVTVGTIGCALQLRAQRQGRAEGAARADALTRAAYSFAFPVWTFAVATGAIWAEQSWGRYWGWDPKEIWAFVSWVILAAYLHSRHTASTGKRTPAIVGIVAYGCLLFNFVGVNIWFNSLHSYAGL